MAKQKKRGEGVSFQGKETKTLECFLYTWQLNVPCHSYGVMALVQSVPELVP